jgi:predicted RNA binding protein YcfA (HicA-like mRNA interferase family)
MNSREVIQRLEKDGWVHIRTKGSHWQFKHPTKDFPAGTLRAIMKQAGWREI